MIRRRSALGSGPIDCALEERTLLAVSIADISVLEGNGGPATVNGTLDPAGESDLYQFAGNAGQEFFFDNVSTTSTAANWNVYGPDGRFLTSSNIVGDFRLSLPASGNYTLALTRSNEAGDPINYEFRIFDVSAPTVAPGGPFGVVQSGTVGLGESDTFTFTAPAGQNVLFDSLDRDDNAVIAQLVGPSGTPVFFQNASFDSNTTVLPESGTYTLVLSNNGGDVADYSFRLITLPQTSTPLTLGSTVFGNAKDFKTDVYRFDGAVGQRLFFDALATTADSVSVRLVDPTGDVVGLNQGALSDGTPFTLTESGTYYLIVEGGQAGDRNYEFRLIDLAKAPARAIALDSTHTGTLDIGTEADLYTFEGAAGQRVFLDFSGVDVPFGGSWVLYGPGDQYLASNSLYDGGYGEVVLPTAGRYVLAVQGTNPGSPVSYTFRVSTPETTTTTLVLGEVVSGDISEAGEQDAYTFHGDVGQRLYLDGFRGTSAGIPQLFGPDGTAVSYFNTGPLTLTRAGTYRLVIDGQGSTTGDYRFRLVDLSQAVPYATGTVQSGTLDPGTEADFYRFEGEAGQHAFVDFIDSIPANSGTWTLYGPNDRGLLSGPILYSGDGEVVLPADGTYILAVQGSTTGGTASYTFRVGVTATASTPLALGAAAYGSIDVPGKQAEYTFTGAAGQVVYLDGLSDAAGYRINVQLLGPDGTVLAGISTQNNSDLVTLPQAGTYRLVVDGESGATGAYGIRVLDVSQAQAYTPGSTESGTLTPRSESRLYRFEGTAGQRVFAAIDPASIFGYGGTLTLFGPNNRPISGTPVPYTDQDFEAVLPSNGSYILACSAGASPGSFNYSFRVSTSAVSSTPLTFGVPTTGTISLPGEQDEYTFVGAPGQRLFYNALDVSSRLQYSTRLIDPDGSILNLPATLSRPGVYRLIIDGTENSTGDYGFRFVDVTRAPAKEIAFGVPESHTLNPGDSADYYSFHADAGQRITLSPTFDPNFSGSTRIYDPLNREVNASTSGAYVAPVGGTYVLVIRGFNSAPASYSYMLNVTETKIVALTLGQKTSGAIVPGGRQEFTFLGTAGQRIYFDALGGSSSGAGIVPVRLQDPIGRVDDATNAFLSEGGVLTLPFTGEYRLIFESFGGGTATFNFRLVDLAQPPAVPVVLGTTQARTLNPGNEAGISTIQGAAGQFINIDFLSYTQNFDGSWALYGPFDKLVTRRFFGAQPDAQVMLPVDGQYVMIVESNRSGDVLNYSFRVDNVSVAPVTPTGFEITRSGTLAAGAATTFNFNAPAGLLVAFDSLDHDFDQVYAELIDPSGQDVFFVANRNDTDPIVLPLSGTYKLKILNADSSASGNYKFRLLNLKASTTPIAPGQLVTGAVANAEDKYFRLDVTAGQRLYFDTQGSEGLPPNLDLFRSDGFFIQDLHQTNTYQDIGPVTLKNAGTYYLRISFAGEESPSYRFRLIDAAQPPAQAYRPGTTQSGTLDPGTEADVYTFQGTAGQNIYIDFSGSPNADGTWTLYNPFSSQGWTGTTGTGAGGSLAYDGPYTLVVTRKNPAATTVDYTFKISTSTTMVTPLSLGKTVVGSIAVPGEQDEYTFTGTPGQRLLYDPLMGGDLVGRRVQLYSPRGLLGGSIFSGDASTDFGPFTLTEPGTYRLVVNGQGATTGGYSFRLIDVAQPPAQAYTPGTTRSGTLDPGTEADVYTFQGSAGQHTYVDFLGDDPGGYWVLYGPDDFSVIGNSLDSDGDATLLKDGQYVLVVRGISQDGAAEYGFRIFALTDQVTALAMGATIAGGIGVPGEQDVYTFAGAVGQRLVYDALGADPGAITVTLLGPDGVAVALSGQGAGGDSAPFTLTQAGAYRLVFDGLGAATGGYSFRLIDVAQPPAQAYTPGTTRSGTLEPGTEADVYTFDLAAGDAGRIVFVDFLSDFSPAGSWTLYGPSDQYLAGNSIGLDGEVTPPGAGRYVLVVAGNDPENPVDYSFRITTPGPSTATLPLGQAVSGAISEAGEQDVYTFAGAVGQRLVYDALGADPGAITVTLLGPDGVAVALSGQGAGGDSAPFTLTQAGAYRLVFDGLGAATGGYSFRLIDVAQPPAQAYTPGTTRSGTLEPGTEADVYTFDLAAGDAGRIVFVDFLSDFSPAGSWTLYGPSDQYLAGNSIGLDGEVTPPGAGRYVLVVAGNDPENPVDYSFRITTPGPSTATLPLGQAVSGAISEAGEQDVYTFAGAVGQRLYLDGLSSSSSSIFLSLVTPDGATIASFLGADQDFGPIILPQAGNYRLIVDGSGSATGAYSFRLLDVAAQPTPQIGTGKAVVRVSLSAPQETQTYITYATADGTATAGQDYVALNDAIRFGPGVTERTIVVPIVGDLASEPNETFAVNLTSASGDEIADGQAVVTILNDDSQATLAVDDVTRVEGDPGTTAFIFTVTLSEAVSQAIRVDYATADGTATAGSDYVAASGTLTFAPGQTTRTVTVLVDGDTDGEANETFTLNLSNATHSLIADGQGLGTINNDDARVSIGDVTLVEGNTGTTTADFIVTLSAASSLPVTVSFGTADGSAVSPDDYTATTGTITFAPGETSKTVSIPIRSDAVPEADEDFFVNLNAAAGATIADPQGRATIRNDDAALTIGDLSFEEGDSGTTIARFLVTIPFATTGTITVDFATADGTATAGSDYLAAIGSLTFAPGETSKFIDVVVNGDTTPEADETFTVTLSNPAVATLADASGQATIRNDDAAIVIDDVAISEGDFGATSVGVTVRLTVPSTRAVTVDYATANGSAVAVGDYTSSTGTLTFAPGETTATITLILVGDATPEPDEALVVNLSSPTNAVINDSQATVSILNDDAAITIADASVVEGDSGTSTLSFVVTIPFASTRPVTVDFATATAGSDFAPRSGTLTFAPGETSQIITIDVAGDSTTEPDETVAVTLSNANGATIADGGAQGVILNDDAAISVNDVSVAEGDSGSTGLVFTLSIPFASSRTITVHYATADGSAVAGADYTSASGTVTFLPGQTSRTVTVSATGDTLDEADETFSLLLSQATGGATIADGTGLGKILDDDSTPTLSIGDASASEGDSGATTLTFTVTLSAASGQTVKVDYATGGGTATAGTDFTSRSGTLNFAPGETSKFITIDVVGDSTPEPDETVAVTLSDANGATIADGVAQGTILNDDAAISIGDASIAEGDSGSTGLAFTLSIPFASSRTITVHYATAYGSAVAGADYLATSGTVTFLPGQTSRTVTVSVLGDGLDETDETFNLTLSGATGGATIADAIGVGTILDDDPRPTLSIGDASIAEGDSGTTPLTFTVTLSAASGQPVTVDFATGGGTATAGSDFAPRSGTLTFAPGETVKTVTVDVLGDATPEPDEALAVTLSNASGASIADGSAQGTILNDDAAISIGDASIAEGDTGTATLSYVVTLPFASSRTVTVDYATAGGTATSGVDFTARAGSLTFAPGQTSKTISVLVNGDTAFEADETFTVALANASNATLAGGSGLGTIVNDDPEPPNPAPRIASFVVDDGTAQRSMVRTLTVTFDEEVRIDAGAFEVRDAAGALIPADLESRTEGGRTTAVLSFSGAGIVGKSLADGNYTLTVRAVKIRDLSGLALDGDGDGAANDDAIRDFYRFFGDTDGDRDVDALDYSRLSRAFGTTSASAAYASALDFDGDGDVDAADVAQFRQRYTRRLRP